MSQPIEPRAWPRAGWVAWWAAYLLLRPSVRRAGRPWAQEAQGFGGLSIATAKAAGRGGPTGPNRVGGPREHRRIAAMAPGVSSGARLSGLLDLGQIERSGAPEPLDVPADFLVVREAFERGVHGLLDRAGARDAPSSLQEIVADVHETHRHELSISDPEAGYISSGLTGATSGGHRRP